MRIAGKLRKEAGPFPDHIFLVLKVRRSPQPHMCRQAPKRSKESDITDAVPVGLCDRIHHS